MKKNTDSHRLNKTVAIIIPVWNGEAHISECIESLINQTYNNYRIIITFDESSDNSLRILKEYASEYKDKIFILYSPQRNGLGAARDYAVTNGHINEDYVIFVDSDDIAAKDYLYKLVTRAEETNADLTLCGIDTFDDADNHIISTQIFSGLPTIVSDIKSFYQIAYINPCVYNKLYKREVIEKISFASMSCVEDSLYLMRALPYIQKISFVKEVLYHYRVSNSSAIHNFSEKGFRNCWHNYQETILWMDGKTRYKDFSDFYPVFAMIRCGIGMTYRVSINDMKNIRKYAQYSRKKMDSIFPDWKKNKYLKLEGAFGRSLKVNAVSVCAMLYKIRAFEMFVWIYWIFNKLTKKEIRM